MWADFNFTDRLFQQGIKGHLDAFSIHPYSEDRSPLFAGADACIHGSFIRGVPAVRDVQLRYGDTKPLWLTEFGWSTTTVRNSANWLNGVDESVQAKYVSEALLQMRSWSYVEVGIYFNLLDTSSDPASTIGNFGLVRRDFTDKPALAAFRAAAAAVHATATATATPAPTATPTATPVPTATPTPIATPVPSATPTPTPAAVATPTPTPTPAPILNRGQSKKLRGQTSRVLASQGSPARVLRVRRVRGGLRVTGRATPGGRVALRVYRRQARRPVAVATVTASRTGFFGRDIRRRALQHGRLRVTASNAPSRVTPH